MRTLIILLSLLVSSVQLSAHSNVAVIAMDFFKSIRENNISHIEAHFISLKDATPLFPREARSMTLNEKEEAYLKPQRESFHKEFESLQEQIKNKQIDTRKIVFHSYKLDSLEGPMNEEGSIMAMSLYFTYNKTEHIIPISVVKMNGHWYALEILHSKKLFD